MTLTLSHEASLTLVLTSHALKCLDKHIIISERKLLNNEKRKVT